MNELGLERIETALGISLPADYRRAVAGGEAATNQGFWQDALFNDPEVVIERTNWLRGMTEDSGSALTPPHRVVSEVNGRDCVLIDASALGQPLPRWDHETSRLMPFVESLYAYATAWRNATQ